MTEATSYVLPAMLLIIVFAAVVRAKSPFTVFTQGAREGLTTVYKIAPSLIGLITAVEMFKASGGLDVITACLAPVAKALHFPAELMPLSILRPISGSGALALLNNALISYGSDSFIGRVACVICASSETTFYTTTLYYGSVGVKRIRHTLLAGLAADFAGMVISSISVSLLLE